MIVSRRQTLLATLFGAGGVGLRALATGLPVSFFLDPRRAMAGDGVAAGACSPSTAKPQFIIFSTSGAGDPINAGAPGTVGVPGVYANPNTGVGMNMTPTNTPLINGQTGQPYPAAYPWSTLPPSAWNRTLFFHLATNTPIHPKEPDVLELGQGAEMLPSLLAEAVSPRLKCVQPQPICLGAPITYQGAPLPIIPPSSLAPVLLGPTSGAPGVLTKLQSVRDKSMKGIYDIYRSGTPAQKAYMSNLINTQTELRSLSLSLLASLSSITSETDPVQAQLLAAVTLFQMNVAPVCVVSIPFGGDNHFDPELKTEATQMNTGVASLNTMLGMLQSAGMQDQVTFISLNVFGRTLAGDQSAGRGHNANHQVSVCIGAPFKGGVIGGCTLVKNAETPRGEFGAMSIDPATGAGGAGGSGVQLADTMLAFGKTMVAAVGGCASDVAPDAPSNTSAVITGALAAQS